MDIPIILEDFLNYIKTIKGKSSNTVKEYFYDLNIFFRFLKIRFRMLPKDEDFNDINISDLDEEILRRVKLEDLHAYIAFVDSQRDNKNSTKARKVASIRSFFNYLHDIRKIIDTNPATQLESPKMSSRQPIYLSLSEAERLLDTVKESGGKNIDRDYAIMTLFLNCGLRLSELVSIDLDKIRGDILTVVGKGNKERTIYLNIACVEAIEKYIEMRPKENLNDPKALFISRQKNRLSEKTVQHMVKKYIKLSGLDAEKYSVHKLRHTAATLMYKYGDVDIRALQQILGHENVSTTQIYTHVDDDRLRDAINRNPLANN